MREPSAYFISNDEYDPDNRKYVSSEFNRALSMLGPESQNTYGFFWTITPKNTEATEERCDAIANGLNKLLSRKLWKRRSRYQQVRSIRAVEEKETASGIRHHVHGITLVNKDDLYEIKTQQEISNIILDIAYGFHEVNNDQRRRNGSSPPVRIKPFIYFDDPTNKLTGHLGGTWIKYLCKTATHTNRPLD